MLILFLLSWQQHARFPQTSTVFKCKYYFINRVFLNIDTALRNSLVQHVTQEYTLTQFHIIFKWTCPRLVTFK